MALRMEDQVLLEVLKEVMTVMSIRLKHLENECPFSLQKADLRENPQAKKNPQKDLGLKSHQNPLSTALTNT